MTPNQLINRVFVHVEAGDVNKAVGASLRLSRHIGDHLPDRYPVIELDARKYRATTIQNGVATILKVVSATGLQLHASAALVKGAV